MTRRGSRSGEASAPAFMGAELLDTRPAKRKRNASAERRRMRHAKALTRRCNDRRVSLLAALLPDPLAIAPVVVQGETVERPRLFVRRLGFRHLACEVGFAQAVERDLVQLIRGQLETDDDLLAVLLRVRHLVRR